MKKVYSITITAYDRLQPTHEEVADCVDDLMRRKIAEATNQRGKPAFKVEVVTDFSGK